MQDLIIQKTKDTPEVRFLANGHFSIEGRSYNRYTKKFFDPLISFCQVFSIDSLHLEIKLDYINTSSSKMLVELLKTIDTNKNIHYWDIKWVYEEDDEAIFEIGQVLEESSFAFNFFYSELRAV